MPATCMGPDAECVVRRSRFPTTRASPLGRHSAPLSCLLVTSLLAAATTVVSGQSVVSVKPGNIVNGDYFGASTALNAMGTLLAVGAIGRNGTGAIFMYTCGGGTCAAATPPSFRPSGAASGDGFASSMAMSATGATIVAGSPNKAGNVGTAYVFTCDVSTGVCVSQVTLSAQNGGSFGVSVAVNGDGSFVAVGAYNVNYFGMFYTYACSVGSCTLQQSLQPSGTGLSDAVGYGMAWSADTSTLVVSSRGRAVGATRQGRRR